MAERIFSEEEVKHIFRHAAKPETGRVTLSELFAIGAEVGLSEDEIRAAVADFDRDKAAKAADRQRKADAEAGEGDWAIRLLLLLVFALIGSGFLFAYDELRSPLMLIIGVVLLYLAFRFIFRGGRRRL